MKKRKLTTILGCILVLIVVAAILSWITTFATAHGRFPKGQWVLHVQDEQGRPLSGVSANLLHPKTGKPKIYKKGSEGPFDNYVAPGSVLSNQDGVIQLVNTRELQFGCQFWDLFWIWTIYDSEKPTFTLELSAPNRQSVRVSVDDLISQKQMIVTLDAMK